MRAPSCPRAVSDAAQAMRDADAAMSKATGLRTAGGQRLHDALARAGRTGIVLVG